jgi:hypothetical protein
MLKKRYICLYEDAIKILYRQCARWAAASVQDDATIIKMLHANYAAGFLFYNTQNTQNAHTIFKFIIIIYIIINLYNESSILL